jgi:phosphatidate cytidylyltransferase
MTTFQQRALTATVFAAVMLTGLFWHETSFFLLFFIISMGCLWEFLKLTVGEDTWRRFIILFLGILIWINVPYNLYHLLGAHRHKDIFGLRTQSNIFQKAIDLLIGDFRSFLILIVLTPFLLLIFELFQKDEKPFEKVSMSLLGIMYTIFPFQLFHKLSEQVKLSSLPEYSISYYFTPYIVAGVLFLTWANDTFAYLIGSRIGKTPLLPRISPKKTWEGTIGGAVMCILTGIVISFFFKELPLRDWAVVGGIVAIFGTIGDLVESMLKRSVGVKDSGSFMPGHGGFLDRFDAFIFAVPFVFLYLVLIK